MTRAKSRTWTEQLSDDAGAPEPIWVEVSEGPSAGARCLLETGTLFVGSDAGCDLEVRDRSVSRRHLSVELLAGAVRVSDLGSRNGTVYLGAKISDARVPIGGSVRIGRCTLRFAPQRAQPQESRSTELHGLLGASPAARRMFAQLEKLGPSDATVLIRGESGTGKDSVARVLHALSPRARQPYQVFSCGAVNPNLIESELFGHARGAFTGADRLRVGAVEAAGQGTLLLDEVGALPLELQPKLLRVLESREFQRVGDGQVRRAEMRVLASSQVDLDAEVKAGRFRRDLYFRLAVVELFVPALRERVEDIPLLARHFARQLSGVEVELAASTLAALQCDPWPGNLRELRNAVERVLALGALEPQSAAAASPKASASFKAARERVLDEFEKDYLATLLGVHRGNVSHAAKAAGLARSAFYRLLNRHGLARE
ncbi:MAG: sigma 54-dependent Fis family transcriptional regulator [Archangiaceae bacterium]|nr:sigma 54-dependent Fis family transcriptional regulator [Archangiaceae bacterium]